MSAILVGLTTVPLAVALLALVLPLPVVRVVTLLSGVCCFAAAVALVPTVAKHDVAVGFLRADALSLVFTLATAFLYGTGGAYSIGYLASGHGVGRTYARRFYAGLNLFAWSMLCAPLVDGLALLWIAVEITTVVSALLVALDDTDSATEAAWKYVLLASAGLGIGLLATVLMYYAGASVVGQSYDLAFDPLLRAGPALPATAVQLAFVLAVLGFGTKVGLFPVHTWLPDAHSEAPTPVSALLSGSLLAVSFYAVLRYYQIAAAALGPEFPRRVLLVAGILSLLLAATYLLDQRDVKRLLAYSSVEHMGILCIGVGLGAPVAVAGVLLHVLGHAAAKGNAFFGAGVLVRVFQTKDISRIRAAQDRLPWTAPLFLAAVLALCAMPPFGLFRSEFQIVAGGLTAAEYAPVAALVSLVTLAFLGLVIATTRMMFAPAEVAAGVAPAPAGAPVATVLRREPSGWMVAPMLAGLAALVLLGVHPPAVLVELLGRGAAALGGAL